MKPFDQLADEASIEQTIAALAVNQITAEVVDTAAEARTKFFELLPEGASVMDMTSETLRQAGIAEDLHTSGKYKVVKDELKTLDREKDNRRMKELGAAPEWAVGSTHAITEDGHLVWASQTGSQLPAYAYGADHIILVASTKKIVANIEEGMQRLREYSLPLEAARAKIAYGAAGSAINRILIINAELTPGRIHLILVKEDLGF